MRKIVTITVIIGTIFISIFAYLLWRLIAKHKGNILTRIETMYFEMLLYIILTNVSGNQQVERKRKRF